MFLNETVPVEKTNTYGFGINLGVCLGITLVTMLGFAFPLEGETDLLESEKTWIVGAAVPAALNVSLLLVWLTLIRWEPLEYCIKKGNERAIKTNLKNIYIVEDESVIEFLYESLNKQSEDASSPRDSSDFTDELAER